MNNVTTILVVKDTTEYLSKSLDSILGFTDEVLIADIGMDKSVAEKLRKIKKVTLMNIDWEVAYVELIRDELRQMAKHEYVLMLDPDEIVPPSLLSILRESIGKYDYVKIPRKNIIFGKWIQHSRWWPDYQIRFFKKDSLIWPKVLHTQPEVKGNELVIEPKENLALIHYNYKNLDEYLSKASRYAKGQAQEDIKKGESLTFAHYGKLGISEFVGRYFSDDGYKDGMHGFSLAFLQMMYYFLVYFYVWERIRYEESTQENVLQSLVQFFSRGLMEISYWGKQKGLIKISLLKSKLQSVIHKLS